MCECLPRKLFLLPLFLLVVLLPTTVLAQSGFQAIIHSTSAEPVEGQVAFTVRTFLSVLDSDGVPVNDLTVDHFQLTEDSKVIKIDSIEPIANEDINLVLVMDTSGSMLGQGIVEARNAASSFLQRLGSNDQAAVISFNDEIKTINPFTNNHQSSSEAVKQITATNLAGTCLYDAAYKAIEMASTTPPGRRAVVLFTDGVDETASGEMCSFHTIDDVLDLAKTTSTPVYSLGMGNKIDENELKRLAAITGGSFLASRNSSELDGIFSKLYDQLNNEYVLTYTSTNSPGSHSLTLEVEYRNQTFQTTSSFVLPALPTSIALNSPAEGETLTGKVPLIAKLLTQGAQVASVEFAINGVVIGKDISEPYELEWDVSNEPPGAAVIEAVAMGKDGAELARSTVNVSISEPLPILGTEEASSGFEIPGLSTSNDEADEQSQGINLPMILGIGVLVLAGIILLVVLGKRRKKSQAKPVDDDFALKVPNQEAGVTIDGLDLRELAGSLTDQTVIATLIVQHSDDPTSVGHEYSITKLPVILGRSAEHADILFSGKDQAISRRHAQLDQKGSAVSLRDLGSKYGTFHNGNVVKETPVILQSGDEIRLGTRTRLRFEQSIQATDTEAITYDNLDISEQTSDATRDSM